MRSHEDGKAPGKIASEIGFNLTFDYTTLPDNHQNNPSNPAKTLYDEKAPYHALLFADFVSLPLAKRRALAVFLKGLGLG